MESKDAKERIFESKKKLFDHKVISKKEYENNVVYANSSDGCNKSWDLWMAGNLF